MSMRISHDLIAYQVLSDRRSRAVATRLEYDDRRPHEVRVVFHTDRRDAVAWVFARDLLLDGLGAPSGCGDVRIQPSARGDGHLLSLLLTGEDGVALIELPAAEVGAFALQSLRLVPRGREPQPPDLDALTAQLLA
ncbi:Streptomyces sporulation and cell division protein, SsgA [Streptacidiphilus jiangxiensis]|uniref:Streptomyces sporulation and cell division protein, SsgA n=2 Tax=Streptacidiphilus jiangxiensis TaxID=235985 RepID=A0A1H7TLQ2_STRJI|nr:SsgA family sporulation/cell division regulator [Streptacidiphilus jiangxiensis]SEL85623.1 Streptomyces sporulation and cell division protein, SsgA [Streptacidiphilus jiangxiensis]